MFRTASLSTKLIRIGASLLVVALASISLTLWVTWQLEGGAAAVNEAGRMRMQTWRLASAVQTSLSPAALGTLVSEFDDSLKLLRAGDPSRPLFVPWDDQVDLRFAEVDRIWAQRRAQWLAAPPMNAIQSVAAAEEFVKAIDALVLSIEQQLSRLTAILNLFQFVMMALAIIGAVVMLFTGYMYVINPLGQLRQGLKQVEAGDFSTRIEVEAQDEFGPGGRRVQPHGRHAPVAVRWAGGPGRGQDPPYRGAAGPSGGAVRGQCLPRRGEHHRRTHAGLCPKGACGDEGRCGGRALG
jgi:two-component system nitrate/nitrite sensor histidine kinase NarX